MQLEKQIFRDCFDFLKRNLPVKADQEYWNEISRQAAEIEQKYHGEKMAVNMLYACTERICELNDKQNAQQGGNDI